MSRLFAPLSYLWLPAFLLAVLVLPQVHSQLLTPDLAHLLAWMLPALALLLGSCFQASRIAYAALTLLAVALLLRWEPVAGEPVIRALLTFAALNIALVTATADRGLLGVYGLLLAVFAIAQCAALVAIARCCEPVLQISWPVPPPVSQFADFLAVPLDRISFLDSLWCLLLPVAAAISWHRREHTAAGLLVLALLLCGTYVRAGDAADVNFTLATAGLLLILLALRSAYQLAFYDELTGIPSRRAYTRYLLTLGRHYCIAVVDVDHFKKLNDRHGHQTGDQALRMVASRIARFAGGRAFRYGGEEFVVVLRGKNIEQASRTLEAMRAKIAEYPLRIRAAERTKNAETKARRRRGSGGAAQAISIAVSVGLAARDSKLKSPQAVMRAADAALYKAKRGGRNRLCVHKAT